MDDKKQIDGTNSNSIKCRGSDCDNRVYSSRVQSIWCEECQMIDRLLTLEWTGKQYFGTEEDQMGDKKQIDTNSITIEVKPKEAPTGSIWVVWIVSIKIDTDDGGWFKREEESGSIAQALALLEGRIIKIEQELSDCIKFLTSFGYNKENDLMKSLVGSHAQYQAFKEYLEHGDSD